MHKIKFNNLKYKKLKIIINKKNNNNKNQLSNNNIKKFIFRIFEICNLFCALNFSIYKTF